MKATLNESAWMDIETAPKNIRILLFIPKWNRIVCGEWDDDKYKRIPKPYWNNDQERLFGTMDTRRCSPSHWMLLPEVPNTAISGK